MRREWRSRERGMGRRREGDRVRERRWSEQREKRKGIKREILNDKESAQKRTDTT
jgi:hypothetical protein